MQKHFLKFGKVFTNVACSSSILISNNSELSAKYLLKDIDQSVTNFEIPNIDNDLFQGIDIKKKKKFLLAEKKEINEEGINSYGIDGGPLKGLIGTADLRLQTITLIGSEDLIITAERYLKSLDVRHRQVALTIKIMDVNLTKTDIKDNIFELRTGDTRIINNSGLGLGIGNSNPGTMSFNENVESIKEEKKV